MARTLTYNELKQTVNELEKDLLACKNVAEDAVKSKKELLLVFNAVPDLIAVIDTQYRIQQINKSLADRLSCTQEELRDQHCYKSICQAARPPSSCPHSRMLKDGKEHIAETYNEHLGTNLLITISPLYDDDGKLIGGVTVARDITNFFKIFAARGASWLRNR